MIPSEELKALLLLRILPGVGDRTTARLLRRWGSARRALSLPDREFREGAGAKAVAARRSAEVRTRVDQILERAAALGAAVVGIGDRRYPAALEQLVDPPPILFLRGDPDLLGNRVVTVVGSRRSTPGGRRTAERLSRSWSDEGITIASGMALGIDAAAHRGALDGEAGTIAVLGCGPDVVYPQTHRRLFGEILERGLLVSEFPPGELAQPHHFPRRNRILAAIAQAVVVVEAARRSGALITVDHALDLGREVFAVPGSVESPQSEGANELILDGATPLTSPGRLLRVMEWPSRDPGAGRGVVSPPEGQDGPPLRRLLHHLGGTPTTLDRLVASTGEAPPRLLASLAELELLGEVRRDAGGWCRTSGWPA